MANITICSGLQLPTPVSTPDLCLVLGVNTTFPTGAGPNYSTNPLLVLHRQDR